MTKKIILNAKSLAEQKCFIGKPVEREIKWNTADGEVTATVFVKPLAYADALDDIEAYNNAEDSKAATAKRIASSIVDESGEPVFKEGDINGTADPEQGPICSSLTMALLGAIGEVNGLGKS